VRVRSADAEGEQENKSRHHAWFGNPTQWISSFFG
jgi:hypothetical protein